MVAQVHITCKVEMMAQVDVWRMSNDPDALLERVNVSPEPGSLDAVSKAIPGGAYTTFRTFPDNRVIQFSAHTARLEETARLAGKPIHLAADQVRAAVRAAAERHPAPEKRLRVTLDLERQPGSVYIAVEALHVPAPADYERGVNVVTRQAHRNNPKAKLTSFLATASELRQTLPAGINEALMVDDDGRVLEGLTSNFFAVQNGEVWTAEEGVLSGLTRALVLEEAARAGVRVRLQPVQADDLAQIQEAFLTSASRAVLPVTRIDGRLVQTGAPGPVTLRLLARYQARIDQETEAL
jgi:branched-chain amino acid aminotransferase